MTATHWSTLKSRAIGRSGKSSQSGPRYQLNGIVPPRSLFPCLATSYFGNLPDLVFDSCGCISNNSPAIHFTDGDPLTIAVIVLACMDTPCDSDSL